MSSLPESPSRDFILNCFGNGLRNGSSSVERGVVRFVRSITGGSVTTSIEPVGSCTLIFLVEFFFLEGTFFFFFGGGEAGGDGEADGDGEAGGGSEAGGGGVSLSAPTYSSSLCLISSLEPKI